MPTREDALLWPAILYALLIVFGSLYPFSGWIANPQPFAFLAQGWPDRLTRTDAITNVLAYFPFGVLLVLGLQNHLPRWSPVLGAVVAGITLSLAMEGLQGYLPGRHSSFGDWMTNSAGTAAGALLGIPVRGATQRMLADRRLSNIGIALLVLWALTQINLELPSLLAGRLQTGFLPAWESQANPGDGRTLAALVYFSEAASLCLFSALLLPPSNKNLTAFVFIFAAIVATKLLAAALLVRWDILHRLASLEVVIGLGGALVGLPVLCRLSRWHPHLFAATALTLLFVVLMLARTPSTQTPPINITDFAHALSGVWPMLAVAWVLALRLLRGVIGDSRGGT
jgi:VanZ family protein